MVLRLRSSHDLRSLLRGQCRAKGEKSHVVVWCCLVKHVRHGDSVNIKVRAKTPAKRQRCAKKGVKWWGCARSYLEIAFLNCSRLCIHRYVYSDGTYNNGAHLLLMGS